MPSNIISNIPQKENPYTLYNLFSRSNMQETPNYGNYSFNYNEIFPNEEETKDYFKNHTSLFNDDPISKEKIMNASNTLIIPKYLDRYEEKTLFYIFYFMSRDVIQLLAAVYLYRKGWVYNYQNQIWFKKMRDGDKWVFFNPLEWKKNEYVYGPVESQYFLPEEEAKSYLSKLHPESKTKKKQAHKGTNMNNTHNTNNNTNVSANANTNANNNPQVDSSGNNNNQKTEQKTNNA